MIAKWYQRASPLPLNTPERMPAMPTARLGAPPVRESSVDSPISLASIFSWSGVTMKPHCAIACDGPSARSARAVAGPTFIAK
jgi:hypothetical protein